MGFDEENGQVWIDVTEEIIQRDEHCWVFKITYI